METVRLGVYAIMLGIFATACKTADDKSSTEAVQVTASSGVTYKLSQSSTTSGYDITVCRPNAACALATTVSPTLVWQVLARSVLRSPSVGGDRGDLSVRNMIQDLANLDHALGDLARMVPDSLPAATDAIRTKAKEIRQQMEDQGLGPIEAYLRLGNLRDDAFASGVMQALLRRQVVDEENRSINPQEHPQLHRSLTDILRFFAIVERRAASGKATDLLTARMTQCLGREPYRQAIGGRDNPLSLQYASDCTMLLHARGSGLIVLAFDAFMAATGTTEILELFLQPHPKLDELPARFTQPATIAPQRTTRGTSTARKTIVVRSGARPSEVFAVHRICRIRVFTDEVRVETPLSKECSAGGHVSIFRDAEMRQVLEQAEKLEIDVHHFGVSAKEYAISQGLEANRIQLVNFFNLVSKHPQSIVYYAAQPPYDAVLILKTSQIQVIVVDDPEFDLKSVLAAQLGDHFLQSTFMEPFRAVRMRER